MDNNYNCLLMSLISLTILKLLPDKLTCQYLIVIVSQISFYAQSSSEQFLGIINNWFGDLFSK